MVLWTPKFEGKSDNCDRRPPKNSPFMTLRYKGVLPTRPRLYAFLSHGNGKSLSISAKNLLTSKKMSHSTHFAFTQNNGYADAERIVG